MPNTCATSPRFPPSPPAPRAWSGLPLADPPPPQQRMSSNSSSPQTHPPTHPPTRSHPHVQVWNPTKDTNVPKLEEASTFQGHFLGVVSMSASADGRMCAVSSLDGRLRIWNLEDKSLVKIVDPGPVEAWGVSFHPKVGSGV